MAPTQDRNEMLSLVKKEMAYLKRVVDSIAGYDGRVLANQPDLWIVDVPHQRHITEPFRRRYEESEGHFTRFKQRMSELKLSVNECCRALQEPNLFMDEGISTQCSETWGTILKMKQVGNTIGREFMRLSTDVKTVVAEVERLNNKH